MRVFRQLAAVAALATLAVALPAIAEDLTITYKVTSSKGLTETSTDFLAANKIRHSDANSDMIFELTTGRMIVIDHKKKEYWESTAQEREAMFKQMEAQMKQAEQQMANVPAAMREKMAGIMGGMAAQVKVVPGQSSKKIAGYICQQYTITVGDNMKMEQWVTHDLQLPIQYFEAQKAQYAAMPAMKSFGAVAEEMKKIKGMSLGETTWVKMMGISNETTREATEVKKVPIPASAFDVPAGYLKKDSPFAKPR